LNESGREDALEGAMDKRYFLSSDGKMKEVPEGFVFYSTADIWHEKPVGMGREFAESLIRGATGPVKCAYCGSKNQNGADNCEKCGGPL
jgi:hypothetical protein